MRIEIFDAGLPGAPYRIHLAVPACAAPPNGWPMVTLLGLDAFDVAHALMRYHADCRAPGYLERGILLGVGYAEKDRRQFDYTPRQEHPDALIPGQEGGANAFLHFLLHTLYPGLDDRLHLDPARQTLAGHSLGGLFTLHTLFTQPDAFQTYIASSPSVWWGARYLEHQAQQAIQNLAIPSPIAVQLSAGEYEQALSPLEQTRISAQRLIQIRTQRAMIDGNRRLAQTLTRHANLHVSFHVYPGQYHRSVWANALNLGLMTALRKTV